MLNIMGGVFTPPILKENMANKVITKGFKRNGKGSVYRVPITDKQYQENYNKIFKKKANELNK